MVILFTYYRPSASDVSMDLPAYAQDGLIYCNIQKKYHLKFHDE